MLTTDDLKEIRKVVREEVVAEVKDSTRNTKQEVILSGSKTRNDISDLDDRLKNIETRSGRAETDMKEVKKGIKSILKTVETIVGNYDDADVKLDRRITRIEDHLNLPTNP